MTGPASTSAQPPPHAQLASDLLSTCSRGRDLFLKSGTNEYPNVSRSRLNGAVALILCVSLRSMADLRLAGPSRTQSEYAPCDVIVCARKQLQLITLLSTAQLLNSVFVFHQVITVEGPSFPISSAPSGCVGSPRHPRMKLAADVSRASGPARARLSPQARERDAPLPVVERVGRDPSALTKRTGPSTFWPAQRTPPRERQPHRQLCGADCVVAGLRSCVGMSRPATHALVRRLCSEAACPL